MPNRRNRLNTTGTMVYMVSSNDEIFNPNLEKPFDIKNFTALDDFVANNFTAEEKATLKSPKYFYEVKFNKPGGLVMPIIVELTFEDGTTENYTFPAQIWIKNDKEVSRTFATQKILKKIVVDPKLQTADIDLSNNVWPTQQVKSKFD